MADPVSVAIYKMGVDNADFVAKMNAGAAASTKATAALEGTAVAEEKVTKATRATAETLDRKIARLDPLAAAERRYNTALAAQVRYEEEGIGTAAQRLRLLDLERAKYDQSAAAVRRMGAAQAEANASAGFTGGVLKGSRIGGLGAGLLGGIVGGAAFSAITELPRRIAEAVKAVDDLGDAAERAGVSGKTLQVFRYELEQGTGSAEDADKALEKFHKTVGELALTGKGPAAEAMHALGISIRDANGEVKTQEELLAEVTRRFPLLRDEATAAGVAARLFGKEAGASMEIELRKGAAGIQAAEEHLQRMNLLMGEDLIRSADLWEHRFNDLTLFVEAGWQKMTLAALNYFEHSGMFGMSPDDPRSSQYRPQTRERTPRDDLLSLPKGDLERSAAEARALDLLRQRLTSGERSTPGFDFADIHRVDRVNRAAGTAEIDRQANALKTVNQQLDAEYQTIGKSAIEQRIMNTLRQVGVERTSAEGKAIEAKIRRNEEEQKSYERLEDAINTGRDLTKDFGRTVLTDLQQGKGIVDSMTDAFGRLAQRLEEMALDRAIDALFDNLLGALGRSNVGVSGPFGHALGNAFDHGSVIPFHAGGIVNRPTLFPMARGMGLMGEDGPEAIMPLRRSSDGRLGVAASGSGMPEIKVYHTTINQAGGDVQANTQVTQRSDGGVDIETMISRAIDSRVEAKYGQRPRSNRRGVPT